MESFRKYLRPLLLSVAFAVLVYLLFALALDWQKSYEAILSLSAVDWIIILALSLVNYILRAARWCGYLIYLGNKISIFHNFAIFFVGFAFTTTPGKIGETVRSVYLKQLGVPFQHSLAAFFSERLLDVITMILLSLFSLYAFSQYKTLVSVFAILILGVLVAIRSERLQGWLARWITASAPAKLKNIGMQLISFVGTAALLLKSGPLAAGLALGLIGWGAEGYALHIILTGLGVDVGWPVAVGVYSVAILAGAASFIPGGLGSTEAVMSGSLILLGVDPTTALAATLICRVVTLWFAVAIGLVVLFALESTKSANPRTQPESDATITSRKSPDASE